MYNKFQEAGSVEPKKQHKPRSVLTEETLDDIGSVEENNSELWEILQRGAKNGWTTKVDSTSPPSIKLVSTTICKIQ